MMDFSGTAGAVTNSDVIPRGLLVWAILDIRGVKSSGSGGQYLDAELTVDEGQPFARRKIWEMIGDPNHPGNSDKYKQMGAIAITRILEAGRGAGPQNVAAYKIADYRELSGLRVPIKVGVEAGKDGHDDKNRVAEWLTPNPQSQSGYKGYAKLASGDHGLPQGNGAASAAPAPSGFGSVAAPTPVAGAGFGAATPAAQPGGAGATSSGFQTPPVTGSVSPGANNGTMMSPSDEGAGMGGWLGQAPSQ